MSRARNEFPESPKVAEGVRLLDAGVMPSEVARRLKVSPATVNVWFLRWIVYPEWRQMKYGPTEATR